jgi:hypothetical protein
MENVNRQITDAVTQNNVIVVGSSPSMATASLYQTMAHSTGLMFANAVNAQNQQFMLSQAATTQGVMQIYSMNTISNAMALAQLINRT